MQAKVVTSSGKNAASQKSEFKQYFDEQKKAIGVS